MANGLVEPVATLVTELERNFDFNLKIIQARRILGFAGGNSNDRAFDL